MNKVIVIVGPTGVGKTKLSIALAKAFNGEIINGDSMQIYKGLDIGTAKIKEAEKENINHHLFDIKEVDEYYSVYNYQQDGRKVLADIIKREKIPIIVGGTGLYIKALLYDYEFNEEDKQDSYDEYSNEELYDMLLKIDPNTSIHINNRKRIVRALNYYHNNKSLPNNNSNRLLYDAIFIGLTMPKEELYERIDNRVNQMIDEGLIKEVEALYQKNIRSRAINTGIGYKELYQYFDHHISLEEAINLIKRNSRRYAKRQYTWFNNKMDIKWFNVNINNFNKTVDEIKDYIKKYFI